MCLARSSAHNVQYELAAETKTETETETETETVSTWHMNTDMTALLEGEEEGVSQTQAFSLMCPSACLLRVSVRPPETSVCTRYIFNSFLGCYSFYVYLACLSLISRVIMHLEPIATLDFAKLDVCRTCHRLWLNNGALDAE